MSPLVPLTLFGLIPGVIILFQVLPARRAMLVAFFAAWMFLPVAGYQFQGLPDYTKISATCVSIFLATFISDARPLMAFRLRWFDLPMILWAVIPFASSMANGYGIYDGLSNMLNQIVTWVLPYAIGRIYITDLQAARELVRAMVIGAMIYVPLCLFEMRMSPRLHEIVYGFHQADWFQSKRGSFYRPTVFMVHGLAVATFMCTGALAAVWLWWNRTERRVLGAPLGIVVPILLVTAAGCLSLGALVWMVVGILILAAMRLANLRTPLWAILFLPLLYPIARTFGGWDGLVLVDFAKSIAGPARADSLWTRLNSENELWYFVQGQKWLGAARFMFVGLKTSESSKGIIADSLWMIYLGKLGLIGLATFFAAMLAPIVALLRSTPRHTWTHPAVAPVIFIVVACGLHLADCLSNAMINPVFILAFGAAGGLVPSPQQARMMAAVPHMAYRPSQGRSMSMPYRPSATATRSAAP